jgi:hypothetical protein
MLYSLLQSASHADHDPTQCTGVTVGAIVGVGVGSGVGSGVGLGVGGAVHAPSPALHALVTTLGFGQFSPLMRWILEQSTPHSVYSSLHSSHAGCAAHTSDSPSTYSQSSPRPCFVTEILYTIVHAELHPDHDPTQSIGVTVGAGVGVGVGSGVGSGVGTGVGGAVHVPSPTTHFNVTSPGCGQSSPKMRWIFAHAAPQSVYSSEHRSQSPSVHTSAAPWLTAHLDPVPCGGTEMLYTLVHSASHADHDPTQSIRVTVGAGVGVGVGSGVGADVGACVGGAVHAPSPTAHFRVTSPGCRQSSPLTRCIFVQSASHSVYCSVHSGSSSHSSLPLLHTSSSPLSNTHADPVPC